MTSKTFLEPRFTEPTAANTRNLHVGRSGCPGMSLTLMVDGDVTHPGWVPGSETLARAAERGTSRYADARPEPRRRGSSTSRSASPSMLKPNTAREMAALGNRAIHGA